MTGFLEVVVVAFVFQLAVLPGEKVQFIIAGLSTRYHPLLVVAAAGSAFAGWTALEIVFGAALKQVLPGVVLDGITATLFILFAYMLLRSAPEPGQGLAETDGGTRSLTELDVSIFGREVPSPLGGFIPIFAMMAAGEFGDKTQIITFTLAARYGATPAIWLGEMAAIIPVSLLNAYLFHHFSHRLDLRKAHYAGAAIFAFFGADTLLSIAAGVSVWETVVSEISAVVVAVG